MRAKVPAELKCTGAAPMRTVTDEISLCGCYVETMFTMDMGTKQGVSLSLRDTIARSTGIVVTKYPQVGNGIDFVDMAPEDRLKLSEYIERLNESSN